MNCQLFLEPFDNSFRKPYHLSCPHTFCFICLNDLKEKVCPNCKKLITEKHPNEAIMELILKTEKEKLNQINKHLNHFKASNSYLDNSQIISAKSSGLIVQKGTNQNKPSIAMAFGSNDQKGIAQIINLMRQLIVQLFKKALFKTNNLNLMLLVPMIKKVLFKINRLKIHLVQLFKKV